MVLAFCIMLIYTHLVERKPLYDVRDYSKLIKPEELKMGDVIIHEEEIKERVHELAEEIAEVYREKNLLLVGLLKGASFITTDLMKELFKLGLEDVQMDFMTVSSYGEGTTSAGKIRIDQDMTEKNPQGRHVLVVDDIADTLHTFAGIAEHMQPKGLASFATLSLLEKPDRHEVPFPLDFVGFKIPDVWVEGYGMDTGQYYRGNPNIVKGGIRK